MVQKPQQYDLRIRRVDDDDGEIMSNCSSEHLAYQYTGYLAMWERGYALLASKLAFVDIK